MLSYNFVGADIIKDKYMKCYFLVDRDNNDNNIGYSVLEEFMNYNPDILALIGDSVRLIYTKNYRGQAVLQAVEPLGKD